MKIAILAPPWLSTYPGCYYGIESVVHNLTTALYQHGHEVELFTVKGSRTKATRRHWYHRDDQYKHIHRPWYEVLPVISAHILEALDIIRQTGDFDIIHDHNSFTGPTMLAAASDLPPILHTLHEPLTSEAALRAGVPDNRMLFAALRTAPRLYFNGVSRSQLRTIPRVLKKRMVQLVYNGVDLADYEFQTVKKDFFLTVGRIAADKGQGTAAKLCHELGEKFKFAGTIGSTIATKRQLMAELAKGCLDAGNNDLRYYKQAIERFLIPGRIQYLGAVYGDRKKRLFAEAKGFLAPIQWEEPFGIAVVDALSSGTPVIAYRRGAFPEIIRHGKNGFLADNERDMRQYMCRISEIDPEECRRSVADRFSAEAMAGGYLERYAEVIARSKTA